MHIDGVPPAVWVRSALARTGGRELTRPVLVVGCGRSGTTILGSTLGEHPSVTYLNEPRRLWAKAYPETDIWSRRARARGGQLLLGSDDTDVARNRAVRRGFQARIQGGGGTTLVEKLPANSFRLGFVRAIFPEARFIHIFRNGLEVARSIAQYAERDPWWGAGDYKWHELTRIAGRDPDTACLPELCTTHYHRGLLEWRLTTDAVVRELAQLPSSSYLELSYAQFVEDPVYATERILKFVDVAPSSSVSRFVSDNVARRSEEKSTQAPSEFEAGLGGPLLPLSMDPAVTSLVIASGDHS